MTPRLYVADRMPPPENASPTSPLCGAVPSSRQRASFSSSLNSSMTLLKTFEVGVWEFRSVSKSGRPSPRAVGSSLSPCASGLIPTFGTLGFVRR